MLLKALKGFGIEARHGGFFFKKQTEILCLWPNLVLSLLWFIAWSIHKLWLLAIMVAKWGESLFFPFKSLQSRNVVSYGHRWPKKARDVLNHQVDHPSKDLKNRNHERSCAMLIPCPSKILLSSYCTHSNHIGWYSCELFHSHCCCELDHLELFFF